MPLSEVDLPWRDVAVPADVLSFLREAERRIEAFQRSSHVPGFVPSDFVRTYGLLRSLTDANLASGNLFCEWGSGFGVITCLAAMLDFDATGIEIEGELVYEAQRLANDFGLPVEFMRGSFIPKGWEAGLESEGFAWLTTDEEDARPELEPDDFNVIFAYPWPDEEGFTESLFEHHAGEGALLISYHGGEDLRLRRKKARKRSRNRK